MTTAEELRAASVSENPYFKVRHTLLNKAATELESLSARIAELEKALNLMEHKVITCGVCAENPEAASKPPYSTDWDSKQAGMVRKLAARAAELEKDREREREKCKEDVCMYCGGRALGYSRIPDGPNEAGNWTHLYTTTKRSNDRVLCLASAIFARERFDQAMQK